MQKSDWKKCKLGDIADVRDGTHDSPKEVTTGGVPLVTSRHISNGKVDLSNTYNISVEDFNAINLRSKVDCGDILISMIGTVGQIAYVNENPTYAIKNVGLIKPNDLNTSKYLFYYLKSPIAQEDILSRLKGTTQQYLSLGELRNFPVTLPPLEEQKRIAQILGALDDKIELLQKQNKTLEDMAKAIFKSWFVDFDVVYAKQKGLPKADIMREYHLTDELYDLFPSDFENSSLGPIPLGWQATTFKTITTQEKTRVGSQELPVLSAVKTGELVLSEDFFNKKVFSNSIKNYIVVPRLSFAYNPSRINIGSIGCNHMNSAGCVSPVYVVFSVISGYENYMEFIIHSTSFSSEVAHRASGTVRQSLSYQDLSYIPVIKPSKDIISMFDTLISYWQQKQILNNKQIQTLTELRDTLLPPLISGKIRV